MAVEKILKLSKNNSKNSGLLMTGIGKSTQLIPNITNGRSGFFSRCLKRDWRTNPTSRSTGVLHAKRDLRLKILKNGLCERCGSQVVQKKMRQWVLKMTDYADRLLEDLDKEEAGLGRINHRAAEKLDRTITKERNYEIAICNSNFRNKSKSQTRSKLYSKFLRPG